jgi:hypothetical protein
LEPADPNIRTFFQNMDIQIVGMPDQAFTAYQWNYEYLKDNLLYLNIIENAVNPYMFNANLGNVPIDGYAISWSYGYKELFFR